MNTSLQLASLFETPVILDTLPQAESINAALKQAITTRRKSYPGVRKSNWNGWQSDTDMLSWGGSAASEVSNHFLRLCDGFTALTASANFVWAVEMWANVSPPGAANEAHVHPGAVWSAVYYVDDGLGGVDEADAGGELVLYDPRLPFVRMLPFDLRYRKPNGKPADSQTSIRPKNGMLVMFPPWLLHSVHPFNGRNERISIAMNALALPAKSN